MAVYVTQVCLAHPVYYFTFVSVCIKRRLTGSLERSEMWVADAGDRSVCGFTRSKSVRLLFVLRSTSLIFLKWFSRAAESKLLFLLKNKWCVALPLTPQSDTTAIMVMLLGQSAQQDPVKHLQCRRVTHSSYY